MRVTLRTAATRIFVPRLRRYLNDRGIVDEVISKHLIGWNGQRVTIPITDREGNVACFKLAKDPADTTASPKMLFSPARAELYGWERVLARPEQIIICEGEFDRLVLESQGFAAVTFDRRRRHVPHGMERVLRWDSLYIYLFR